MRRKHTSQVQAPIASCYCCHIPALISCYTYGNKVATILNRFGQSPPLPEPQILAGSAATAWPGRHKGDESFGLSEGWAGPCGSMSGSWEKSESGCDHVWLRMRCVFKSSVCCGLTGTSQCETQKPSRTSMSPSTVHAHGLQRANGQRSVELVLGLVQSSCDRSQNPTITSATDRSADLLDATRHD